MSRTVRRRAVSPLGYADGRIAGTPLEMLAQAFADFHDIGFTAVRVDVPPDMHLDDYAHWIGTYELAPVPGVFAATFDGAEDLAPMLERARLLAAQHTALGLDRIMLIAAPVPDRLARPAVGANSSRARLARVVDELGAVAATLASEGVRPLLHPRVGGLVETEAEVTAVLASSDVLGFGPDTGHLRWAGMDPAALIRRYADRVGGVHLSDVFADFTQPARRGRGKSYGELVATGRVWAEPGAGVVDLEAVLAALPGSFDGDVVAEIERPSHFSVYESHRLAYEWMSAHTLVPVAC
ncbi:sugar phosphate isomerase/epimerase family protein [Georgenia sp. AZ-5]|uniref:sugar phosphate isomerase/epimerase family protein n=1 Tax=Georgenia sp. AZ-5 TaxID=3367526 RepID=UPI00375524FF